MLRNLDGQVFEQRREESALPIRSLSNANCRYATDVRKRHGTWSGISLSPTTGFEGSLDSPPKRISKNNRAKACPRGVIRNYMYQEQNFGMWIRENWGRRYSQFLI